MKCYLRIVVIQEVVCLVQSSAHLLGVLDAIVEHQRLAVVGQREQEVKDRVEVCVVGGKQPGGEMPAAQALCESIIKYLQRLPWHWQSKLHSDLVHAKGEWRSHAARLTY